MRRLKEKISQYGIGVRMAVCFIGLVILPFILLAFIMFYSFQNYTVNNLSATTRILCPPSSRRSTFCWSSMRA